MSIFCNIISRVEQWMAQEQTGSGAISDQGLQQPFQVQSQVEENALLPNTWIPKEIFKHVLSFSDVYPGIYVNKTWHEAIVSHPTFQKVIKASSFIHMMQVPRSFQNQNVPYHSPLDIQMNFRNVNPFGLQRRQCELKYKQWKSRLDDYQNKLKAFEFLCINTTDIITKMDKIKKLLIDIEKYKCLGESSYLIPSFQISPIDRLPSSLADLIETGNIKGLIECIDRIPNESKEWREKILEISVDVLLEKEDFIGVITIFCALSKSSPGIQHVYRSIARYFSFQVDNIENIQSLLGKIAPLEAFEFLKMGFNSILYSYNLDAGVMQLKMAVFVINLIDEIDCVTNEEIHLKQKIRSNCLFNLVGKYYSMGKKDVCAEFLEAQGFFLEGTLSALLYHS